MNSPNTAPPLCGRTPGWTVPARLLLLLFVLAVALAPGLGGCSSAGPSASASIDAPDCTMADVPGVAAAPKAPLAAPNLPLVQGASVGSLPGSGHVGATGEYNYTVPIDIPAGRAGMQPALSLTYSSRGPNGHVGVGFSLGGMSAITHCARTVVTDGYREGPSYNDDDRLCLDGHVLIPIGPHPAGTEYRTEDETFTRIVARKPDKEHIDGFMVWTKDGRVRSYAKGGAPTKDWFLDVEWDRAGNAVRYTYATVEDEYFPVRIDYTEALTLPPSWPIQSTEPGQRRVELVYEDRPDVSSAYVGNGVRVRVSKRLREIQTYAPSPSSQGPALAWRYTLSYAQSTETGVSLLTSVERCGALNGCLPARTFTWESSSGPSYEALPFNAPNPSRPAITADLDGDGRDEILFLQEDLISVRLVTTKDNNAPLGVSRDVTSWFNRLRFDETKPVDLDGDGRFELVGPDEQNQKYIIVGLDSASASEQSLSFWGMDLGEAFDPSEGDPVFWADLDGDGLPDLIKGDHDGQGTFTWSYRLNLGGFNFGPSVLVGTKGKPIDYEGKKIAYVGSSNEGRAGISIGPFERNGEKLTSFKLLRVNGGWEVGKGEGYGGSGVGIRALADLNGDGWREPVWYQDKQNVPSLCHDAKSGELCTPLDLEGQDPLPSGWRLWVTDLDGDGRDDVLLIRNTLIPNGQAVYRLRWRGETIEGFEQTKLAVKAPMALGDFDGDGLIDVAGYAQDLSGWTVYRQTGRGTVDLLAEVGDAGMTAPREKVIYSTRWSDSPEPASCAHPQRCIKQGFLVAREHHVLSQPEQPSYLRALYSYEDPRGDGHGRGFLGFGVVCAWEPERKAETITTFDHVSRDGTVYPGALRPKTIRRAALLDDQSKRARIVDTSVTYSLTRMNQDQTYFIAPSAWTSTEWENDVILNESANAKRHLGGIAGPNAKQDQRTREGILSYDDYGNVIYNTVWTHGGTITEMAAVYEHRPADWLVSLLWTQNVVSYNEGEAVPKPRRVEHQYDPSRGLLCHTFIERNNADPSVPQVITYHRAEDGQVRAVTRSAAGLAHRTSHLEFDAAERIFPVSAWNDLGHITRAWVHPALGVPLVVEDPNGVKTTTKIDDMGRRIEVSPDGGAKVSWSFSTLTEGRSRVHTSSATGSAAEVDLDALGRPARARYKGFDGQWIEAETTYDALGRVVAQSRPGVGAPSSYKSSYVYDLLGRVVEEVAPDGATTIHTYSFFATHTWDPKLNETATLFDVDGRVAERVELIGHEALTTTFGYGAFGQLDTITDPKGNVTSMGYDHLGRRTWIQEPNAGLHVSTYNGFSERTAELPPAALPINYEYDAIGRLKQRTDADGTATFTWDAAAHGIGKLAGTSSTDGVKEVYSYDTKGRLAWRMLKTGVDHFTFDYHYDAQGRLDTLLYPEAPGLPRFSIGHTYNSAGYLKTVFDASTLTQHKLWAADDVGPDGLVQATLGNGLLQGRQYDPTTGHLNALQEGPDVSLGYTYDAAGLVSTRTDLKTNRQDSYEYDALHRLVHWSRSSITQGPPGVPPAVSPLRDTQYTFDNLGNLTAVVENGALTESHTYAQNGMPHAVTSNTFGAYSYDARGRQTKAPGRDVTFTERDLPRTVTTNAGVTSFLYDASGARIKKQSATEEVLTFGGLYERRVGATGTRHVFYVAGGEGLVARFDYEEGTSTTEARYLHTDALGSVIAITDAAGALVERLHYEPFGGRRDQDGAALSAFGGDPSLGFTGHEHDDELGLINMRGRVMDPITRRFLTPDPHVTDPFRSQSYNRFAYVWNSPTNLTDPTGFDPWTDGSMGCIGLECLGGPGGSYTPSFEGPGSYGPGYGGPPSLSSLPNAGSSGSHDRSPPPVQAVEDKRPVSLPVGPKAPGGSILGPLSQSWATPYSPYFYQQLQLDIAERIAFNNMLWDAGAEQRYAVREYWRNEAAYKFWSGAGGAPPAGFADALDHPAQQGHLIGIRQLEVAAAFAPPVAALARAAEAGVAGLRAAAAARAEWSIARYISRSMDPAEILEALVAKHHRELAANPAEAAKYISLPEQMAGPRFYNANFGKALEKAVGREVDKYFSHVLEYTGFMRRGPDFIGVGRAAGRTFDITTLWRQADHYKRPYGATLELILYEVPPNWP